MKIYKIIISHDIKSFEEEINKHVEFGFVLEDNLIVSNGTYYQKIYLDLTSDTKLHSKFLEDTKINPDDYGYYKDNEEFYNWAVEYLNKCEEFRHE